MKSVSSEDKQALSVKEVAEVKLIIHKREKLFRAIGKL